jgi:hypothetical protein
MITRYRNHHHQEGHGIFGSIFGKMMRLGMPLLKQTIKTARPHVARIAKNTLRDVLKGKSLSASLKSRSKQQLMNAFDDDEPPRKRSRKRGKKIHMRARGGRGKQSGFDPYN